MVVVSRLSDWFSVSLDGLRCSAVTKSYVIGTFSRFDLTHDMSRESVVMTYAFAMTSGDFYSFQRVGDWALWVGSFHPTHAHHEVIETMGRLSYHRCNSMLRNQWKVYEELADKLPTIVDNIHDELSRFKCINA
jgi:hypothetical protein